MATERAAPQGLGARVTMDTALAAAMMVTLRTTPTWWLTFDAASLSP